MYSISVRANQILFFTLFVLACASFLNYMTTFQLYKPVPSLKLQVSDIKRFSVNKKHKWDEVHFQFDLQGDMESYYNWNVKQLFLYITAEFNDQNQSGVNIIWDKIIPREAIHTIKLQNLKMKYPLRDVYNNLRNQKIKLVAYVEVMPIVGKIFRDKVHEIEYQLPEQYL